MIRFLKHSEIDKDRWNKAVSEASNSTIFVDFDFLWLGNPNWCALVEDDYQSVMPLPVRSKLSIKYVYTPFFYNRMGVFSKKDISPDLMKEFVDSIPRKYRQIDLFPKKLVCRPNTSARSSKTRRDIRRHGGYIHESLPNPPILTKHQP